MKTISFVFICLASTLLIANAFAQTAGSAYWALNSTTQQTVANFGDLVGSDQTISAGPIPDISVYDYDASGQRIWASNPIPSTYGWLAAPEHAAKYLEFNAAPAAGNSATILGVQFKYGAANLDGFIASNVYYSTNGWSTRTQLNTTGELTYPANGMSNFLKIFSIAVPVAVGETFSLRIYPYALQNAVAAMPTFAVHSSVVFRAMTTAVRTGTVSGTKFNSGESGTET